MTTKEVRLEDVFHEVVKEFHTSQSFYNFAEAYNGLKLSHYNITTIKEDHQFSVEEQKLRMLHQWKEKQGAEPNLGTKIWEITRKYQKSGRGEGEVEEPMRLETSCDKNVTILNVHGEVQGPIILGNENVSFDGGNANAGIDPPLDPDIPPLKAAKAEISPNEKAEIEVGGCKLEFRENSVNEATNIDFTYEVDPSRAPEGHIRASATLCCSLPFVGRKNATISLPTWCKTDRSVDVGIYEKVEGEWIEKDRPPLTDEGNLEWHHRSFTNLTAFLSKSRISDVQFSVSCFLYNTADANFAMGFCLKDKAIENIFIHKLKKEGFTCTVCDLQPLTVSLGDEIRLYIKPGQVMTNTKFEVDEAFISSYRGRDFRCELDKESVNPRYFIEQMRKENDEWFEVVKHDYPVHGKEERKKGKPGRKIIMKGDVEAENFLGRVKDVKIDQRTYAGNRAGDDIPPAWEEDRLRYQEDRRREVNPEAEDSSDEDYGGAGDIVFHKKVKAKTFITKAGDVTIDQRRINGRNRQNPRQPRGQVIEREVAAMHPEEELVEAVEEEERRRKAGSRENVQEAGEMEENAQVIAQPEQGENEASPIWQNCEKESNEDEEKSPQSIETGLERQVGESQNTSGLRKRKIEEGSQSQMSGKTGRNEKKKKKEGFACDAGHVALGICLFVCITCILYNYYTKH